MSVNASREFAAQGEFILSVSMMHPATRMPFPIQFFTKSSVLTNEKLIFWFICIVIGFP
jgi:hypothetical protein